MESVSPALAGGFLTAGGTGKSYKIVFKRAWKKFLYWLWDKARKDPVEGVLLPTVSSSWRGRIQFRTRNLIHFNDSSPFFLFKLSGIYHVPDTQFWAQEFSRKCNKVPFFLGGGQGIMWGGVADIKMIGATGCITLSLLNWCDDGWEFLDWWMGKVCLRFSWDLDDESAGDRTLQAQGRRRRLDPDAGAGSWKALQPRSGVFLFSFICLMNWLPKGGYLCTKFSYISFSNPSSAKQTQVPATFRRPVLSRLLARLLIPGLGQLILCLQSMGHHNFLRLMSTWLSFRSVLVLLFLSSRLEVWKKQNI